MIAKWLTAREETRGILEIKSIYGIVVYRQILSELNQLRALVSVSCSSPLPRARPARAKKFFPGLTAATICQQLWVGLRSIIEVEPHTRLRNGFGEDLNHRSARSQICNDAGGEPGESHCWMGKFG